MSLADGSADELREKELRCTAVGNVTKPRLEDAIYYAGQTGRFDSSKPNEANTPQSDEIPNWVAASTGKLTFAAYQEGSALTAIYPDKVPDNLAGVVYCALGLAGEAGEIANKVKKLLRDGDGPLKRKAIAYECGDVLWYIPRLLHELGEYQLEEIARENLQKLLGRKERGTLHGSGDVR